MRMNEDVKRAKPKHPFYMRKRKVEAQNMENASSSFDNGF